MRTFYHLLGNSMLVATKNNFIWFALTYWAYLSTHSVVSTGLVGGSYLIMAALSGLWLGSLVDRYPKKQVMFGSSIFTLILFVMGLMVFTMFPSSAFTSVSNPIFWLFIVLLLFGVVAGNVMSIAVPTLVTILVPKSSQDKANGMFGTVIGLSFAITSVASGLVLGFAGMFWVLITSIVVTLLSILHLVAIKVPETKLDKSIAAEKEKETVINVDLKGTVALISSIPGMFALIFFTTFNNFLGGVFMALMDAYGLTLVSVQTWGLLWGFLSFGFIFGGLYISKKGLGDKPLRTLFRINTIIWTVCIFFTIQPSIVLLAIGALVWMCFMPFIEAIEQTIVQKVVPHERQGRVFGLAHSIEQAASPITAFIIGPIAQYFFIPFMTTGRGVGLIGSWFGVGPGRGIALVFTLSGIMGLTVTLVAKRSKAYSLLAKQYQEQ